MPLIVTSPERIRVGCIPDDERWRFQGAAMRADAKRWRRAAVDRTGPVFLFCLLFSAFVPAVLSEVDIAQVWRLVQSVLVTMAQPTPSIQSGDEARTSIQEDLEYATGRQFADGAALILDGRDIGVVIGADAPRRRRCRLRRRRVLDSRCPRAPPLSDPAPPVPGRI